jgi:hypothetical protein
VKNGSVVLELQRATHATLHLLTTELVDLDLTASEINALGNLADGEHTAALIRQTLRNLEKRALAGLSVDAVNGARAVMRALTEAGQ